MKPSPVWLLTGPETGERNAMADSILAAVIKSRGDCDVHRLYAQDVPLNEVLSLLQNGSLFSSARLVLLRNAELIKKKDEIEALGSWISSVSCSAGFPEATLILLSDEISVDRKLDALVPKDSKKVFWEMFENRKEQWIRDFFRKAGLNVEADAVAAILELVENNTEELRKACTLFTLFFPGGHTISSADVESILEHNREENAFTLFDALAQGNLEGALSINRKISLSRESSPVQVIAGLSWCFRRLGDWHGLSATGALDEFSLKKAGFSSRKAQTQYRSASGRWTAADTVRILGLLADTDLRIRSGGTALADLELETALYLISMARGRSLLTV